MEVNSESGRKIGLKLNSEGFSVPFRIYCLPVAKRFHAKGYQEKDNTVSMAPLGFLNEDVKTAGSTKDISLL